MVDSDRVAQQPCLDKGPLQRPDGTFTFYGVDVIDVSCMFTSQEMNDFGRRGQAYIFCEWVRLNPHHSPSGWG